VSLDLGHSIIYFTLDSGACCSPESSHTRWVLCVGTKTRNINGKGQIRRLEDISPQEHVNKKVTV
jgi:hypothetical protein